MPVAPSPSDLTPWCDFAAGDKPGTWVCTRKGCAQGAIRAEALPIWRMCGSKSAQKAQRQRWPQDHPERGCCGKLVTMATNAAIAAYKAAKAAVTGKPFRRQRKEAEACLAICRTCAEYLVETRQCRRCLCFVELKVLLKTEQCPLEKW